MARRGRISLNERLEQWAEGFRRDPNASVAHFESRAGDAVVLACGTDFNDDFATLSELHRVAHEIDEALTDALRIADGAVRQIWMHMHDQLDAFIRCIHRHHRTDVVCNRA